MSHQNLQCICCSSLPTVKLSWSHLVRKTTSIQPHAILLAVPRSAHSPSVTAFPKHLPETPSLFTDGALVAYGIRNPAGFAFNPSREHALFVVENGASIDNVTGLTAAFVNDKAADEVNVVSSHSSLYLGCPDCTMMWNGSADPVGDPQYLSVIRGKQFSLNLEPGRDDVWCRNRKQ
jgi:hypothetical protein